MRRSVAAILALALLVVPAAAQDLAAGRAMAIRWCMACHVVEAGQSRATDNAPSFRSIAVRPDTTATSLDRYISKGHTLMPDFLLTPQERDALVAYILSLR